MMITIYLCGKGLYWGEIFIIFLIVNGYLMKFIMNMQSKSKCLAFFFFFTYIMFVVLGLRCLLDCHVLKRFGIYMIGILDRLY